MPSTGIDVEARIAGLGLTLGQAPRPVASYVPAVRVGTLLFISGQIPFREGRLIAQGAVPTDVSIESAKEAAAQCALNVLAAARDALAGDLNRIRRVVRLGVFVCSAPGFTDQPAVANGASDLLVRVFGDTGRHARAAVGSVALPLGATVEVEALFEVAPD
ncbi:MAG: RidA family protein [Phycisphaeraceae bacterium]|nr:RidA family protein [Phycisphaeraceae bacterium]